MATRLEIVEEALTWVDDADAKTFRHQGRRKHDAVDCAGLIVGVAKAVGAIPEGWDYTAYPPAKNSTHASRWMAHWFDPIDAAEIEVGDVFVFSVDRGETTHMAWAVPYVPFGGQGMVHAYSTIGRVVLSNVDDRWLNRLSGGYRVRGLNG